MPLLQKIIKFGLYAILLLPLIFTPFTMFPWQFGKVIFFQIIIEILLFLFLILLAGRQKKFILKKLNWLDWSIFIFLAVLILTSVTGVNFANSFFGNQARAQGVMLWLHGGVFYWLLINLLRGKKEWQKYLTALSAVVFFVSLTAVFQNFLPVSLRGDIGGRFSGIIGNPAFLAAYLILPVFLSAYLFLTAENKKIKWLFFVLGLVELSVLFLTSIRGALAGMAVSVLSGLILALVILTGRKYKLMAAGLLVLFFLTGAGLGFFSANKSLRAKAPQLANLINISAYLGSETASTRFMAWQIAVEGFKQNPILGTGWGNYDVIFNKYYNPRFLRYGSNETVWDKPHNFFLEVADATGVIGAISYLAVFILAGALIFNRKQSPGVLSNSDTGARLILVCGLIAYFTQNLFLFETLNSLLMFFAVLAFLSVNFSPYLEAKILPARRYLFSFPSLVFLALVLGVFLYRFHYLPMRASYYLEISEDAGRYYGNTQKWAVNVQRSLNISTYLNSESAIFAAATLDTMSKGKKISDGNEIKAAGLQIASVLEQAAAKYPQSYLYPVWAGQTYLVLGEYTNPEYFEPAQILLERAKNVAPRKQEIYFLLGKAYLYRKNFTAANDALKEAVVLSPDLGQPHWFLGLAYILAGNKSAGITELETGLKIGPDLQSEKNVLYLIDIFAQDKNYQKVVEYYNLLIESNPAQAAVWHARLAAAYVALGDKSMALAEIDKALTLDMTMLAEAQKFIKDNNLK